MTSPRQNVAQNIADTCVGQLNESYGVSCERATDQKGKSHWSISARAVGYVCLTALALFALHSCGNRGLSDEAAKAVSEACKATGLAMYIRLTSSEIKAECVKP